MARIVYDLQGLQALRFTRLEDDIDTRFKRDVLRVRENIGSEVKCETGPEEVF
jgi:hypothetical protein